MKKRLLSMLLMVSLLLAAFSSAAIAAKPSSKPAAHGTKDPFDLSLRALKGPDHTDLYVHVTSKDSAYNVPESLQKIQLKSFTEEGDLVYTKNIFDVASPGGVAALQLTDVERYQPLKTRILAGTKQTVDQEVLEAMTTVLLRPDLVVDQINAPQQTLVDVPFSVEVAVKETNTDLGATAKVSILDGATLLDQADGVVVPAGGAQAVAFALKFSQPGTYTLKVAISDADPGEYDTTNNEATFTVEVITPEKSMTYHANYWRYDYESNYDYSSWWYWESYRYTDHNESFSSQWWTNDQINPGGDFSLTLTTESGATQQVNLTNVTLQDLGWAKYYQTYLPDKNAWINIYQYPSAGTYVYYGSYSGRYHYSNNWYSWYWDSWGSYSYSSSWGQIIGARNSLTVHLDLPGSTGTQYGGTYTLGITPSEYNWNNTWYGWWGDYSHSWGRNDSYYGWGSGQTAW